jgi:hypothetical protein
MARARWRLVAFLLAAPGHALAASNSQDNGTCMAVSGSVNLTADNGMMLWSSKANYEINDMPASLAREIIANTPNPATSKLEEATGIFEICLLPGRDRFGNQIIDILSVAHLSLIPIPE